MSIGLPQIIIDFKTSGLTAIQRSAKGIVALILRDDTDKSFTARVYDSVELVESQSWTAANLQFIKDSFLGTPRRVIVFRQATTATDYNELLLVAKLMKWNWMAVPGIGAADVPTISTWIKSCRENDKKTFKVVLPNSVSDHEGVVNFTTAGITTAVRSYNTGEFCARIAGALAGLPLSRSCTYLEFPEVTAMTASVDPNADIDAGKLILINPDGIAKIGRGVNSLTTFTANKGEAFRKIRIVEGVDLIRDDIRGTFDKYYVGKIINSYENKQLFCAAVNAYFMELERQDVLDPEYDNNMDVSIDLTRIYLIGKGVDVSTMPDAKIKASNTGDDVFCRGKGKLLDAMEDAIFDIYI